MKECTLCKNHSNVLPFHAGYICEDCIEYLRDWSTTKCTCNHIDFYNKIDTY